MLEIPKPGTTEVLFVDGDKEERTVGKARRPRTGRIVAVAIALAAITGAGVVAWDMLLRPVEVQAALAERDVPVQVFGLGTVEARIASKVGFKVSGVVVDLRADVGDHVAKGAVLARLDDREQRALVARAKATTEQAEANLQRALASVEKAQTNHANARSINVRRQELLKGNTTSIEAAESAQAAEDAARADVSLMQSDVLAAKANIREAEAQEQQQSTILEFYTLNAPYDAMITARTKELGSALGIGEPVFTLVDPKTVWALAYIDESKAGEIRVGEPAEIVLRSRPQQRLPGRVARIQPESDRVNEERKIEVAFDRIPDDFNLGE